MRTEKDLAVQVLPTPGPPVMTSALLFSAKAIASRRFSARCRLLRLSIPVIAFVSPMSGQGRRPSHNLREPVGDGVLDAAPLAGKRWWQAPAWTSLQKSTNLPFSHETPRMGLP
jgi:hypothetical protein